MLEARLLHEHEYAAWDDFVYQAVSGSIYSTAEYLEILSTVTGGSYRVLGAFFGDKLVGGIGLYEQRARTGGTFVSNRLLLYYNGIVVDPAEASATCEALLRMLDSLDYRAITLHNRKLSTENPALPPGWTTERTQTYVVSLSDLSDLWNRMEKNARRLIRRAEEHTLKVTSDDDFDSFFAIHHEIHQRKGALLYLSEARFRDYYNKLIERNLAKLYHARLPNGEAVATQLVLFGRHPVCHTVCAGGREQYQNIGANVYLRWKVFEVLRELNFRANDLTDAAPNSVTRFKAQLGGALEENVVFRGRTHSLYQFERFCSNVTRRLKRKFLGRARSEHG